MILMIGRGRAGLGLGIRLFVSLAFISNGELGLRCYRVVVSCIQGTGMKKYGEGHIRCGMRYTR
jgi:hypothetical protein